MTSLSTPLRRPRRVLRAYLAVAAAAVTLFVILRLAAPWLVSRHDDLSLVAAVALLIACPVLVLWAGRLVWRASRPRRG